VCEIFLCPWIQRCGVQNHIKGTVGIHIKLNRVLYIPRTKCGNMYCSAGYTCCPDGFYGPNVFFIFDKNVSCTGVLLKREIHLCRNVMHIKHFYEKKLNNRLPLYRAVLKLLIISEFNTKFILFNRIRRLLYHVHKSPPIYHGPVKLS
jgi:hypothetical protein